MAIDRYIVKRYTSNDVQFHSQHGVISYSMLICTENTRSPFFLLQSPKMALVWAILDLVATKVDHVNESYLF